MIRGIYSSASGMLAEMIKLNNITNNLANIDTDGFKKRISIFQNNKKQSFFREENNKFKYIGNLNGGCLYKGSFIDFSQGNLEKTNNKLDFALKGKGFFLLQNKKGKYRLTRKNHYFLSLDKYIIDEKQNKLLYRDLQNNIKPLKINDKVNFYITPDGSIYENKIHIGNLIIVNIKNKNKLKNEGNTLYSTPNNNIIFQKPKETLIYQGYLEKSNVEIVNEMVKMISTLRAYEVNANILKNQNLTLNLAMQMPITRA